MQLHHKDGNHQNNELSNLEFLCPNCHALTDSWCKNHRQHSFDRDNFIAAINEGKSVRQALLSIGLSDGSANYTRAYKILEEEKLDYQSYTMVSKSKKDIEDNHCAICGCIISADATYCTECAHTLSRRTARPSPEILLEEIATSSFVQVGAKYGVSDNAIRK